MVEKAPYVQIQEFAAEYRRLSDEQLLRELNGLPALPDEDSSEWNSGTWLVAYRLIAVGDVAAERRLRAAILPMLERASYGDPGEMMRGLRNTFEAIVKPDWAALAAIYSAGATSRQRGARLWSVFGLGVLQEPGTFPVLVSSLRDPAVEVRKEACNSLKWLCREHPDLRGEAVKALESCFSDPEAGEAARRAVERIKAV